MTTQDTTQRISSAIPLLLLWLAGNASRLTILAIPPILALIIVDLKLTGTDGYLARVGSWLKSF